MQKKISAVVIWFNPSITDYLNVKSYYGHVDCIYIIDNSDADNSVYINDDTSNKIIYIPRYSNFGIASSLNLGFSHAINDGFEWILTMDQDSSFDNIQISNFVKKFNLSNDKEIAIYSPTYKYSHDDYSNLPYCSDEYLSKVIASGNIVNATAYSLVNGFDDMLFIDEVDYDFCFKLSMLRYKIIKYGNVYMNHSLGKSKLHSLFLKKNILVMHHSSFRKYYIVRNRLIMMRRYPRFTQGYGKDLTLMIFKTLIFEDDICNKIKNIFKGFYDFMRMKKDCSLH